MSGQLDAEPSLTERLSMRLARPVDAASRARARLHLLDWLGCVAGGIRADPAIAAARPRRHRAALAGNALEMDDVHRAALLHPGPVVWAAVCAGARPGVTLGQALDAGVRGYEAMIGVGASFDAHHYAHWHNSATAGGFGAAAARGALRGLDAAAMAGALGHAGSLAGGLWRMRHEPGHAKQAHIVAAARTGALAASLAAAGLHGPRFILEGEQGLYAATCRAPLPEAVAPDDDAWRIHEVSFKPHAACRHAHPAIDAALALRARGVAHDGVVEVATYADALRFCDRAAPATPAQAKFSVQHAVAAALARGEAGLAAFDMAAIGDPRIAALRARVRVSEDAAFTAAYPAHFGASVTAGDATETVHDALGDPERPLPPEALIAKADALLAHGGLGGRFRARLIDAVLHADIDDANAWGWIAGKALRRIVRW